MPVVRTRSILSGMLVEEAMHRQVVQLPAESPLSKCINHLIRFKINTLLVTDENRRPAGVVSKTDIIGAFYGGLPIDTPVGSIMNGPPLTCFPDDELEGSLDFMLSHRVHQLYVQGAEASSMVGILSYPDVVAILYRYCRSCPRSTRRRSSIPGEGREPQRFIVQEVMTPLVIACKEDDSLAQVIETLMAHRFGAVLVLDDSGGARGVISKTDLVLAYNHGMPLEVRARAVMNSPVAVCYQYTFLSEALRQMFFKDVQRLFTHAGDPSRIIGVLSLSDAARTRSGCCRACLPGRIITTN